MDGESEMVVKRVSVPSGLEELMETLTKEVLRKKPNDIYAFASKYFQRLLSIRNEGHYRPSLTKTARKSRSLSSTDSPLLVEGRADRHIFKIKSTATASSVKLGNGVAAPPPVRKLNVKAKVDSNLSPKPTENNVNGRNARTTILEKRKRPADSRKVLKSSKRNTGPPQPAMAPKQTATKNAKNLASKDNIDQKPPPSLSEERAAVVIQSAVRAFIAGRRWKTNRENRRNNAALKIQSAWRNHKSRTIAKLSEADGLTDEELSVERRRKAATIIQALFRGYLTRKSRKPKIPKVIDDETRLPTVEEEGDPIKMADVEVERIVPLNGERTDFVNRGDDAEKLEAIAEEACEISPKPDVPKKETDIEREITAGEGVLINRPLSKCSTTSADSADTVIVGEVIVTAKIPIEEEEEIKEKPKIGDRELKEEHVNKEVTRYLTTITEPLRRAFSADTASNDLPKEDETSKERSVSADEPRYIYIPLRQYAEDAENDITTLSFKGDNSNEATETPRSNTNEVSEQAEREISHYISYLVEPVVQKFSSNADTEQSDRLLENSTGIEPEYQYIPLKNYSEDEEHLLKSSNEVAELPEMDRLREGILVNEEQGSDDSSNAPTKTISDQLDDIICEADLAVKTQESRILDTLELQNLGTAKEAIKFSEAVKDESKTSKENGEEDAINSSESADQNTENNSHDHIKEMENTDSIEVIGKEKDARIPEKSQFQNLEIAKEAINSSEIVKKEIKTCKERELQESQNERDTINSPESTNQNAEYTSHDHIKKIENTDSIKGIEKEEDIQNLEKSEFQNLETDKEATKSSETVKEEIKTFKERDFQESHNEANTIHSPETADQNTENNSNDHIKEIENTDSTEGIGKEEDVQISEKSKFQNLETAKEATQSSETVKEEIKTFKERDFQESHNEGNTIHSPETAEQNTENNSHDHIKEMENADSIEVIGKEKDARIPEKSQFQNLEIAKEAINSSETVKKEIKTCKERELQESQNEKDTINSPESTNQNAEYTSHDHIKKIENTDSIKGIEKEEDIQNLEKSEFQNLETDKEATKSSETVKEEIKTFKESDFQELHNEGDTIHSPETADQNTENNSNDHIKEIENADSAERIGKEEDAQIPEKSEFQNLETAKEATKSSETVKKEIKTCKERDLQESHNEEDTISAPESTNQNVEYTSHDHIKEIENTDSIEGIGKEEDAQTPKKSEFQNLETAKEATQSSETVKEEIKTFKERDFQESHNEGNTIHSPETADQNTENNSNDHIKEIENTDSTEGIGKEEDAQISEKSKFQNLETAKEATQSSETVKEEIKTFKERDFQESHNEGNTIHSPEIADQNTENNSNDHIKEIENTDSTEGIGKEEDAQISQKSEFQNLDIAKEATKSPETIKEEIKTFKECELQESHNQGDTNNSPESVDQNKEYNSNDHIKEIENTDSIEGIGKEEDAQTPEKSEFQNLETAKDATQSSETVKEEIKTFKERDFQESHNEGDTIHSPETADQNTENNSNDHIKEIENADSTEGIGKEEDAQISEKSKFQNLNTAKEATKSPETIKEEIKTFKECELQESHNQGDTNNSPESVDQNTENNSNDHIKEIENADSTEGIGKEEDAQIPEKSEFQNLETVKEAIKSSGTVKKEIKTCKERELQESHDEGDTINSPESTNQNVEYTSHDHIKEIENTDSIEGIEKEEDAQTLEKSEFQNLETVKEATKSSETVKEEIKTFKERALQESHNEGNRINSPERTNQNAEYTSHDHIKEIENTDSIEGIGKEEEAKIPEKSEFQNLETAKEATEPSETVKEEIKTFKERELQESHNEGDTNNSPESEDQNKEYNSNDYIKETANTDSIEGIGKEEDAKIPEKSEFQNLETAKEATESSETVKEEKQTIKERELQESHNEGDTNNSPESVDQNKEYNSNDYIKETANTDSIEGIGKDEDAKIPEKSEFQNLETAKEATESSETVKEEKQTIKERKLQESHNEGDTINSTESADRNREYNSQDHNREIQNSNSIEEIVKKEDPQISEKSKFQNLETAKEATKPSETVKEEIKTVKEGELHNEADTINSSESVDQNREYNSNDHIQKTENRDSIEAIGKKGGAQIPEKSEFQNLEISKEATKSSENVKEETETDRDGENYGEGSESDHNEEFIAETKAGEKSKSADDSVAETQTFGAKSAKDPATEDKLKGERSIRSEESSLNRHKCALERTISAEGLTEPVEKITAKESLDSTVDRVGSCIDTSNRQESANKLADREININEEESSRVKKTQDDSVDSPVEIKDCNHNMLNNSPGYDEERPKNINPKTVVNNCDDTLRQIPNRNENFYTTTFKSTNFPSLNGNIADELTVYKLENVGFGEDIEGPVRVNSPEISHSTSKSLPPLPEESIEDTQLAGGEGVERRRAEPFYLHRRDDRPSTPCSQEMAFSRAFPKNGFGRYDSVPLGGELGSSGSSSADEAVPSPSETSRAPGAEPVTSGRESATHASSPSFAVGAARPTTEREGREPRTEPVVAMETDKRNNSSLVRRTQEQQAATKIQASFRGYQVRKKLKTKSVADSPNGIKRSSGRRRSSGRVMDPNKSSGKKPTDLEEQSATKIQAGVRGFLVRKRQKKIKPTPESP